MSEYQYYEFRAIDRPLTAAQIAELKKLSSRAEVTATSFVNTYNYGDFRGNPAQLMTKYFDVFVYVANWGSQRLMIRVPNAFLDPKEVAPYADNEILTIKVGAEHTVLDFSSELDGGEWSEGEPWMPDLIGIRAELMRGDLRALYLAWLATLGTAEWERDAVEDVEDDESNPIEPPVPPGLANLSASLRSLAEFLRVEDELIEVAAAESAGTAPTGPTTADMASWINRLPQAEKDAYLFRVLTDESNLLLRAELSRRFRAETLEPKAGHAARSGRRRVAELLDARDALLESKRRQAAERAAKEKSKRQSEEAAARAVHLDALSRREASSWLEVDALIASRLPKNYDTAVQLLVDLRDLARRSGRAAEAEARIFKLRQQHKNKPSLMDRLQRKNLDKSG